MATNEQERVILFDAVAYVAIMESQWIRKRQRGEAHPRGRRWHRSRGAYVPRVWLVIVFAWIVASGLQWAATWLWGAGLLQALAGALVGIWGVAASVDKCWKHKHPVITDSERVRRIYEQAQWN